MTSNFILDRAIIALATISLLSLSTAFYFEYFLNLAPCNLCLWQRWPHALIVIFAFPTIITNRFKSFACLLSLIFIITSALLAGYHTGIEAKYWPGPQSCSGIKNIQTLSSEAFLSQILKTPIIQCDKIAWSFLKLSMAGWNFLISISLIPLWLYVTLTTFRNH